MRKWRGESGSGVGPEQAAARTSGPSVDIFIFGSFVHQFCSQVK